MEIVMGTYGLECNINLCDRWGINYRDDAGESGAHSELKRSQIFFGYMIALKKHLTF